jgi:hypothetical protein
MRDVFIEVEEVLFDIRIEDQDQAARLLRESWVLGAAAPADFDDVTKQPPELSPFTTPRRTIG